MVGDIVKKVGELDKMLTPWDSDKLLMVDVGCYERGCSCTSSDWAAGIKPDCVPMVPYKPWVGLTDEEMEYIWGITPEEYVDRFAFARAVEAKLKEKNGG